MVEQSSSKIDRRLGKCYVTAFHRCSNNGEHSFQKPSWLPRCVRSDGEFPLRGALSFEPPTEVSGKGSRGRPLRHMVALKDQHRVIKGRGVGAKGPRYKQVASLLASRTAQHDGSVQPQDRSQGIPEVCQHNKKRPRCRQEDRRTSEDIEKFSSIWFSNRL